jgi:hypothetical protein
MSLENSEMTASYSFGLGSAGQKRVSSVALNATGESCEIVVPRSWSKDEGVAAPSLLPDKRRRLKRKKAGRSGGGVSSGLVGEVLRGGG